MKNACIIGFGAIGPVHAQALLKTPLASLYGICDCQSQRLECAKKNYPGARLFNDFKAVLSDPQVHTVHICTPHYLHEPMAYAALLAGKDVVLEKPVCLNTQELALLEQAANDSGHKLCVVFQNRMNPCFLKMKEVLSQRMLGNLLGLCGFLTWHRDAAYYLKDPWRGKRQTEGGGLLINQAIHMLDLMGLLGGGIQAVTGSISTKVLKNVIEVEDTADAVLETKSGVPSCFFATNCYGQNRPMQLEAHCENGLFRYADGLLYKVSQGHCDIIASDSASETGKSYWGTGHTGLIHAFYRTLETGDENGVITLKDTENTMKALFAFYESAKTSERIIIT